MPFCEKICDLLGAPRHFRRTAWRAADVGLEVRAAPVARVEPYGFRSPHQPMLGDFGDGSNFRASQDLLRKNYFRP